MAGNKALRKIQIGKETTAGTAVAATTIWRGMGTMEDQREVVFVEEDVGQLGGADRTYIPFIGGGISFESVPATFEQLPYILEAGIMADTPSQDGSGSDYIYTYTFPTTAAPTVRTYTIEAGDDNQAEEMEYSFVQSFTLSGRLKEAMTMSADWIGRQVTNTTYTTSLTLPSVEEILFQKASLYIDNEGSSIGTSQVTSTLVGMDFTVATGLQPIFSADGNLYFASHKSTPMEVTLAVTFEHNGSAVTEKTAWRNQTPRQIRVLVEGAAVETAGSTYSNKTLIIDMAGKWEKFDKIGDQDGNDIVTAMFRARYNTTADLFAEMVVVNELSALP